MIDREPFRQIIVDRKQALTNDSEVSMTGASTVELDQSRVGRLSRMDALQMQQMDLESERRRMRELVALDAALERIDNNDFGECAECGEQINPKRLEANPVTTLCIGCAEIKESG